MSSKALKSLVDVQEGLGNRNPPPQDLHVAIIMDGNGRWANQRGYKRTRGHRIGAGAAEKLVRSIDDLPISCLTLFALSQDNLARPPQEVATILTLLRRYARRLEKQFKQKQEPLRLEFIGERQGLPDTVLAAMRAAEQASQQDAKKTLRIAVNYSARAAIIAAAKQYRAADLNSAVHPDENQTPAGSTLDQSDEFLAHLNTSQGSHCKTPTVDLLIRTGGETRISDFMLWEAAYAELWFTDTLWPDFTVETLKSALSEYRSRNRRFGLVAESSG